MIEAQLSPRVAARLLIRLSTSRLTPVAKAALRHERKLQRLFLREIRKAQDAVPMSELEDALQVPGTGAVLYVMGPVIEMLLEETSMAGSTYFRKADAGGDKSIKDVFLGVVASGAEAADDICIIGNQKTQSWDLGTKPIKSVSGNSVTFQDETKAFFKPAASKVNETAVRVVAEKIDALPLLPSMTQRTVDDKTGVLFDFIEGKTGAQMPIKTKFGAGADAQQGATLDFILGNSDRNANNWIVRENGRLSLVDHDVLFSSRTRSGLFEYVVEIEQRVGYGEITRPAWLKSPKEMVEGVNTTKLLTELEEVGVSDAARESIRQRIDLLRKSETWEPLYGM